MSIQTHIDSYDLSSDPEARKFRKTATVTARIAENDGAIETLEGRVPFNTGDVILRGIEGEEWPVKADAFQSMYEQVASGSSIYKKKANAYVYAKQIFFPFTISLDDKGARISGESGDWLVQYKDCRWGVVRSDIFNRSYECLCA